MARLCARIVLALLMLCECSDFGFIDETLD